MPNQNSSEPCILSSQGSGRATAYAEHNKIVTLDGKTHVVWLDADAERFWVRGRTLDRASGEWSEMTTIGEAEDNHGGPGLTVDSCGYLHIIYFPHHGPFRYRRSSRVNDLSKWDEEICFGEGLSYPMILCAADDTLIVTARRGYHDAEGKDLEGNRMEQELWKKPKGGDWKRVSTILRSRHPGYAHFAASMAWGKDHRTIHLNCRIYETNPDTAGNPITAVGYLTSLDEGESWAHADGTAVTLPATADTVDLLIKNDEGCGPDLSSGPLAVGPEGSPHLIYTVNDKDSSRLYLATPAGESGWEKIDLTPFFPNTVKGWGTNLAMGGGMTFDATGRATILAAAFKLNASGRLVREEWGHPSTEIVRIWSDDELQTFASEVLSPIDDEEAHWLANIERPTGHHQVPESPGIIYTAGGPGGGLIDLDMKNGVVWCPPSDL